MTKSVVCSAEYLNATVTICISILTGTYLSTSVTIEVLLTAKEYVQRLLLLERLTRKGLSRVFDHVSLTFTGTKMEDT